MPKPKVNYTELVHRVVHESIEPLSLAEIVTRVAAIEPITTKDPKATVGAAISNSKVIVKLPNGKNAWKQRVISGSVLRMPLDDTLDANVLAYTDEVRDALFPAYF